MRRVVLIAVAGLVGGSLGCSSTSRRTDTPPMFGAAPAQSPAVQPAAASVVPAGYNTRLSSFDISKDCKS